MKQDNPITANLSVDNPKDTQPQASYIEIRLKCLELVVKLNKSDTDSIGAETVTYEAEYFYDWVTQTTK